MIYAILILPVIIMIVGFFMNKYPPKKANWFVGYRTRRSMKNESVWKIANEYCGKLWIEIGSIMLGVAFLICVLFYSEIIIFSETILAIIVLAEVVLLIVSGIMVENKIKNIDK